ncbi:MAG TPA: cytochrome c [Bacillota bacterium]|nr:cytochrome c [Bacillota bacterium]
MKNPVIPYLIIAVAGVLLVAAVSYIGISQRDAIQNDDNNTEEQANDNNGGGETADAEEVFKQNCASCHGDDLSGGAGPDLTKVGSSHSADEINDIITNGTDGGMPAGLIDGKEKEAVVEWLSEMK